MSGHVFRGLTQFPLGDCHYHYPNFVGHLLRRGVLVLHREPDVIALLSVLVLDGDGVISGIFRRQMPDGQGAVGPVSSALQEGL